MNSPLKHIVVTVHGIRTFGHWQARFAALLQKEEPDISVFNYVFGYFSMIAFLIPPLRWLVTRRFRRELLRLHANNPEARIDLVGHSFGTHLIGWGISAITSGADVSFHTVILAGSVLRSDFNWGRLIEEGTVRRVISDCGIKDNVLWLSQFCVLFTGMAGRLGFVGMMGPNLTNRYFVGGHSLYFETLGRPDDTFMTKYWTPLIVTEAQPLVVDERRIPTWYDGVFTTILQNFEVVKLAVYTILLLSPAVLFASLYHEANLQRDEANSQRGRANMEAALAKQEADRATLLRDEALQTLIWVFNRSAFLAYDEFSFNDRSRPLLVGILQRLQKSGFESDGGQILLIGHMGNFATIPLKGDMRILATRENIKHIRPDDIWWGGTSEYQLALGQKAAEAARRLASLQGIPDGSMDAVSVGKELPIVPYPKSADPDAWNRAASINNRVEMQLCYLSGTPKKPHEKCLKDPAFWDLDSRDFIWLEDTDHPVQPMTPEQFRRLIQTHGTSPKDWPESERASALAFVARRNEEALETVAKAHDLESPEPDH